MEIRDDNLLLQQLKEGNVYAYEQLFKKYYKQLCVAAFCLLKDEMEAEDLVQNLFIEIWDRQLYHKINTSIKAYLTKAVQNRCLNHLDKEKAAQKRFSQYIHQLHETTLPEEAEMQSTATPCSVLLRQLPVQRQEAVRLVYIKNKKYQEAAMEMGITVNSVKTHLKLALKVLRERFANHKQ